MNTPVENQQSSVQTKPDDSHKSKLRRQRGFGLLEVMIVVVVVGILYALSGRSLGGSTEKANATAMTRMSQKLTDNWTMIAQTCGTTTDPANSPVSGNSATNALNLLIGGNTTAATGGYTVPAAYESCYRQSKVLPLTESAQWDAANSRWLVSSYEVVLSRSTSSGQGFIDTQYQNVPSELALMIVQQFVPSVTDLGAAASNAYVAVHYGAETAGARSVTLRRPVN